MRILHLVSERSWRGGEQQAAYLIETCLQQQVECFVACRKNSAFAEYCAEKNVPFIALPFHGQFDIYTAYKIKQYCQTQKIDLIHLHTANAHGLGVVSHLLGNIVPMVLSRRVIFPIQRKFFSKFKYNFKGIEKIICASEAIKYTVIDGIENPSKCITIYDGIDTKKFDLPITNYLHKKYNIPLGTKLIGNISALDVNKGLYTYIDTAEIILKTMKNVKFFIIGEGPLKIKLQAYINRKNLSQQIILTGFIKNIPMILQELDVFALTTRAEGLGTSMLDAMACGVPVVATNTGGVPEVVLNDITGLLAPVDDAKKISQQILRLLNDPPLRAKLTHNAKNHLFKYFTKDEMGSATIDIYHHIRRQQETKVPISIIVTTYNRPSALKLVLAGLNLQDCPIQFEVIIADDGSTTDTRDLVTTMAKTMHYPIQYLWQEDIGFRAAKMRNKAIVKARGEYIIFLDGDCIPRSSFVRRHYLLAEKNRFVVGNRVLLSPEFTNQVIDNELPLSNWTVAQWRKLPRPHNYNRLLPLLSLPFGQFRKLFPRAWRGAKTCNLSVWRDDLIAINGFDETYEGWGYEDSDLVIRLIRHGILRKMGQFSVPVLHLWHQENDRSQQSENQSRLNALLESSHFQAQQGLQHYLLKQPEITCR